MPEVRPVRSFESYRFGTFELQPDKRQLLKDGVAISLRPRAWLWGFSI